jgi:hypothetical protein
MREAIVSRSSHALSLSKGFNVQRFKSSTSRPPPGRLINNEHDHASRARSLEFSNRRHEQVGILVQLVVTSRHSQTTCRYKDTGSSLPGGRPRAALGTFRILEELENEKTVYLPVLRSANSSRRKLKSKSRE